jgi:hypothetical protein
MAKMLSMSVPALHRYRHSGVLQPGKHWRQYGSGIRGAVAWDWAAVDATLREQAAQGFRIPAEV